MIRKRVLAFGGAVALAGALALGGTAGAAPVVQYTSAGTNAVAGYFANADEVDFTHIDAYIGSDGAHTIAQLPVSTVTGTISIKGGAGDALCNRTPGSAPGDGYAAQIGDVYVGGGLMDVVYATGQFTGTPKNNSNPCENGVVNPTGVNGTGPAVTTPAFNGTFSATAAVPVSVSTALTAAASAVDVFTVTGTTPADGTKVTYSGVPENGLVNGTSYWVVASTATTFELSPAEGGTPVGNGGTAATAVSFSFTVTSAPAVFTVSGFTPANGNAVTLDGTDLPPGFSTVTKYDIVDAPAAPVSGSSFELAASPGGSPLSETAATGSPWTGSFHRAAQVIPGSNETESFGILIAGVPVDDTVAVDVLYDAHSGFHFGNHHFSAGTIAFEANDLRSANGWISSPAVPTPHGTEFTDADAGVITDTAASVALSGTPPLPDSNTNLLVREAHVGLTGNDLINGKAVHGTLQSNADWSATPVAASSDGTPQGPLFLAPGKFVSDHFSVFVGTPVV